YDDPVLGRDPQPADMAHYVHTGSDNGGVHINSGIPNRAFCLTALHLGGYAWQKAGLIWYRALTGALGPASDFQAVGDATAAVAPRALHHPASLTAPGKGAVATT